MAAQPTPVLGIDFGTSNTAGAWVDDRGRVRVIAVKEKVYLLPSVAWYSPKGHVLVGHPARQQMIDDPKNTVFGMKRFLGRKFTSPFVHRYKDRFAYELVEAPDGGVAVKVAGTTKPLEDVAVDIIKRLLELAAVSLGGPVKEVVITVPAHFGYSQRASIRRAASRAGARVKAMVNEPTAAAMYYARKKGNDGTVLVFDLGGGTFDATLMAIVGGVVKVLASGGDAFLGGADFDAKIVDLLVQRFQEQHGIDLKQNTVAIQRVFVTAEQAKIELSKADETRVRVPCVAVQDERFIDLEDKVTRKELEDLTAPLIEKCLGICEDILKRAKLQAIEVDEIVFVGGQTQMPAIQRRLAEIFMANPAKHIHPDLGVVVGAALLAKGDHSLIDVNSMAFGAMLPGGVTKELVPANTPVPAVKKLQLDARPAPGQPLVFGIYEAVDSTSLDRDHLGTVRVEADWLAENPGDLIVEAWMNTDLDLTLFLQASEGGKIPLTIAKPNAGKPAPAKPKEPEKPAVAAATSAPVPETTSSLQKAPAPREVTMIAKTAQQPGPRLADAPDDRARTFSHPGFRSVAVPPTDATQPVKPVAASTGVGTPVPGSESVVGHKSTGAGTPTTQDDGQAPAPGTVVGGYMLLDVIGRGGMGRVYMAEHTKLGRRVALKMLRKRYTGDRLALERFFSEARAVNQIRHENIIEVTDFFTTDDGHTCYIMELLEGRSLADVVQEGRPRTERVVKIAHQVASAMVAVHDAQIIHRDLKPENIFLTTKGGKEDFVKLLDFGVAKLTDQEGNSLHKTGVGAAVGTLEYMSPEQLVGRNLDSRSDVFGLGVVMYEMMTGQLPFSPPTDKAMLFTQLTSEPPRPSTAVPDLRIPSDLEDLIMQCLEKDPDKRPQTMREVKGRLELIAESLREKKPQQDAFEALDFAQDPIPSTIGYNPRVAEIQLQSKQAQSQPPSSPAAPGPGAPTADPFAAVAKSSPQNPLAPHPTTHRFDRKKKESSSVLLAAGIFAACLIIAAVLYVVLS